MVRTPLNAMRFRTQGLASAFQATYGQKEVVQRHLNNQLRGHQGWDLEAAEGTPCYAVEDGIVVDVGFHHDFGNYVNLQFSPKSPTTNMSRADDTYFAFYAHLTRSVVPTGTVVRAGQLIG
jgi:murein DD-endopeptidase MepM/ murein hydrolase activator NlpD